MRFKGELIVNWLDILILAVLAGYALSGIKRGFMITLIELTGIIVSIVIPLFLYIPFSWVLENFGVSQAYSGALAFTIIWVITLIVYYSLTGLVYQKISKDMLDSRINKLFGIFPGFGKGLIFIAFILAIVVAIPFPFFEIETVDDSLFGEPILDRVTVGAAIGSQIFGEPLQNAFGFLTIEREVGETIELDYTVSDPEVTPSAEEKMLELVNEERAERGLPELVMDEELREVAREHSKDMFQRGYFGHQDPDGVGPFDRLRDGGISFTYAGENLATAPTVSIAHQGLMDSPGHKENILKPEFRKVGIGAVTGEIHGIMFTQKFTE